MHARTPFFFFFFGGLVSRLMDDRLIFDIRRVVDKAVSLHHEGSMIGVQCH